MASSTETDLELLELRAALVGDAGSCRVRLVGAAGADGLPAGWNVEHDVDLVYLIESLRRPTCELAIERSDRPLPQWMRASNPGGWHPVEWDELLDGRLGPWAMVVGGQRIVAICHTPVASTQRAAECGVWTDPAFRGRGYAAAATEQWAELLREPGRHLFYATSPDNASSRRVAQRLGLRLLGWQCSSRAATEGPTTRIHPLSSARPEHR